jgi:SAM-dependent methyltransferase
MTIANIANIATIDTGLELRSLYAPDGGVGEIFSSKAADYAASRPDYPAALFEQLARHVPAGAAIADIGAGTGLLTHGLLARGYAVTAVEPSAPMRAVADHLLKPFPHYRSVDGKAEAMPLADASLHLLTAAQAFHWFEVDKAKAECLRVLRPSGKVALIWNDRLLADPLHVALDDLFAEYGGAKRGAMLAHEERGNVPAFFGANPAEEFCWPHQHLLKQEGLLSLVFSRSYMPNRNTPAGSRASEAVRQIFMRFAQNEILTVRYTTVALIGRPE